MTKYVLIERGPTNGIPRMLRVVGADVTTTERVRRASRWETRTEAQMAALLLGYDGYAPMEVHVDAESGEWAMGPGEETFEPHADDEALRRAESYESKTRRA